MEPVLITAALIQQLHYLPSPDRQVLHRNKGRYVGAEWTERGWLVDLCQIADTAAQWRHRYGAA